MTKDSFLKELRGHFNSVVSLVRCMLDIESQLGDSHAGRSLTFLRIEVFRTGLIIQGTISQLEKETRDIMMATQDGRNEEKESEK